MFSRHARILIIDDMHTMCAIIQKLLGELGFDKIELAVTGMSGFLMLEQAVAQRQPFSLVITDWQMPEMSGIELIERCKTIPALQHTPFLFVTAENTLENIQKAITAGAFDYLLKPFSRVQLKEKMARVANLLRDTKTFSKNSNILIVDDSKWTILTLTKMLNSLGFLNLHSYLSGKEALEYLDLTIKGRQHKIDFVITDWNMPNMSGLELFEKCKQNRILAKIPFLLATAENREVNLNQAVAAGISEYLIKPYEITELKKKISRAYRSAQQEISPPIDTRFMIVDDFESMLKIHVKALKALGYSNFFCAKDGEVALVELKQSFHDAKPYDIMITDWHMPKMDGIALTKHCRSDIFLKDIPILMISADGEEANQTNAIKEGVDEFLGKSYTPETLKERLQKVYSKIF
ncbi:MAG: response regulator [Pseudomonadota bacterium]|nr:response regulator [Pseudomonadota bacterium]